MCIHILYIYTSHISIYMYSHIKYLKIDMYARELSVSFHVMHLPTDMHITSGTPWPPGHGFRSTACGFGTIGGLNLPGQIGIPGLQASFVLSDRRIEALIERVELANFGHL